MTESLQTKAGAKIPRSPAMKRAWLITWRSSNAEQTDTVVTFLNARKGVRVVVELVTQIWLAEQAPWERIEWTKHPTKMPYPAEVDLFQRVTMGHNPFLFARVVETLIDDVQSPSGFSWREIERPIKR